MSALLILEVAVPIILVLLLLIFPNKGPAIKLPAAPKMNIPKGLAVRVAALIISVCLFFISFKLRQMHDPQTTIMDMMPVILVAVVVLIIGLSKKRQQ